MMIIKRGRRGWKDHLVEILSLWTDEDCELTSSEICQKLTELKIVHNKDYCRRILRELVKDGYLERINNNRYRLKINSQFPNILNILKDLYDIYKPNRIYNWYVGGSFWVLAEGVILGLPRNIDENPFIKEILNVLLVRLSRIFYALAEIALLAGFAEKKGLDIKSTPPPKEVVREYILEILPYVLGERAGIDLDGLSTGELVEFIDQIYQSLPEKFKAQPIEKQILFEYIQLAQWLYAKAQDFKEFEEFKTLYKLGDSRVRDITKDYEKIALVVYPPLYMLDEKWYENFELYNSLKEYIKAGISNALIVEKLSHYSENAARNVLRLLVAQSYISRERAIEILNLYSLKKAGETLDYILSEYLSINKEGKFEAESLEKIKKLFHEAKQRHNLTNMIKGIWLSDKYFSRTSSCSLLNVGEEKIIDFTVSNIKKTFI